MRLQLLVAYSFYYQSDCPDTHANIIGDQKLISNREHYRKEAGWMCNNREQTLKHEYPCESLSVVAALTAFRPALSHVDIPKVFLFVPESDVKG